MRLLRLLFILQLQLTLASSLCCRALMEKPSSTQAKRKLSEASLNLSKSPRKEKAARFKTTSAQCSLGTQAAQAADFRDRQWRRAAGKPRWGGPEVCTDFAGPVAGVLRYRTLKTLKNFSALSVP